MSTALLGYCRPFCWFYCFVFIVLFVRCFINKVALRMNVRLRRLTSALLCCCSMAKMAACGLVDMPSSGSLKAGARTTSPLMKLTMLSMRAWTPSERLRSRSDSP